PDPLPGREQLVLDRAIEDPDAHRRHAHEQERQDQQADEHDPDRGHGPRGPDEESADPARTAPGLSRGFRLGIAFHADVRPIPRPIALQVVSGAETIRPLRHGASSTPVRGARESTTGLDTPGTVPLRPAFVPGPRAADSRSARGLALQRVRAPRRDASGRARVLTVALAARRSPAGLQNACPSATWSSPAFWPGSRPLPSLNP